MDCVGVGVWVGCAGVCVAGFFFVEGCEFFAVSEDVDCVGVRGVGEV